MIFKLFVSNYFAIDNFMKLEYNLIGKTEGMMEFHDARFQEMVNSNEILGYAVEELERIFRNNFYLSEKEMEEEIVKILTSRDEEIILGLTDIFQKFVDNDIEITSSDEKFLRRDLAKRTIKNCVDLCTQLERKQIDNFCSVLKEAKKFGIDPHKLAIKENLRGASLKSFLEGLKILVEKEYVDFYTNEKLKIFEEKDVKELFEKSASFACGVNEDRVEEVLAVLSDFAYDKENERYFARPESFIRKAKSLLKFPVKRLEENINFLTGYFVPKLMTRKDLVKRIEESPSILLCSPEKVMEFEEKFAKCVFKIVKNEDFSEKIDDKVKYSKEYAQNFAYNLDHFNLINSINKDGFNNIEKIAEVLVKNLGANNAIKCLHKIEVLSCSPDTLDCFLSKLAVDEKNVDFNFRAFFIENTALCLNLLKNDNIQVSDLVVNKEKSKTKREKVEADKANLPEVDAKLYEEKYKALSPRKKKEVDELSKNMLDKLKEKKEKAKSIREERKISKLEAEYAHIEEVKNELDMKKYKTDYVRLLTRVERFLDEKYGAGYAQKTYRINDYIKLYNELYDQNVDYNDVIKRTDDLSDSLKDVKIIDIKYSGTGEIDEKALEKDCSKFNAQILPILKRLDQIQQNALDINKYNIKVTKRLTELDKSLDLKTKCEEFNVDNIVENEILCNTLCMRYLKTMQKVIAREFKIKADTILPSYEVDAVLDGDSVTKDKFKSVGSIFALAQLYYHLLHKNFDTVNDKMSLFTNKDEEKDEDKDSLSRPKVPTNDLNNLGTLEKFLNVAKTIYSWWNKIENIDKETSVAKRFTKTLNGLDFRMQNDGRIDLNVQVAIDRKPDDIEKYNNEDDVSILTNKKCLEIYELRTKGGASSKL